MSASVPLTSVSCLSVNMSYCRYSFEGVLQAIYGQNRGKLDCSEEQCIFKQATDVLEELDVQHAEFYLDFIILCIFFVTLRVGCYLVLRWRVKSQRWLQPRSKKCAKQTAACELEIISDMTFPGLLTRWKHRMHKYCTIVCSPIHLWFFGCCER